ncbi:hypothetical protein ABMA28_012043 [Loxostege sticticalis]|uniref:Uncharacterized protein n=1 Tax=Loxostege sticticalis TaxID=481309 RepID=A0ABD0TLD5_LOXSC
MSNNRKGCRSLFTRMKLLALLLQDFQRTPVWSCILPRVVRGYSYYKDALKKLRTHPGAVHYLGEPIKDKRFKLSDAENNFSDGKTARFQIPVSGPKDRGTYYFWAERNDSEWIITKAELDIKSKPDARLLIVKPK